MKPSQHSYSIAMQFHVIDDDKQVSDVIVSMLDALGFSSWAFNSPHQYIAYAKSNEFKAPVAIMTDVSMPEMNGYKMIDLLKEIHPEQKFVVITASADSRDSDMKQAGMFLSKPVRMETLEKTATSLVRRHYQET